jgi:hypothetical protein
MAQLAAKSERDPQQRKEAKLRLMRLLLERGYSKDETKELMRLTDWFMQLPRALEAEFLAKAHELEEAYKMPFVTSFERAGVEKGRQEGEARTLLRLIERKFGAEAKEAYRSRVEGATSEKLLVWTDRILDAEHVEDVFADG